MDSVAPARVDVGYTPPDKVARHVLGYEPSTNGQTRLVWRPPRDAPHAPGASKEVGSIAFR